MARPPKISFKTFWDSYGYKRDRYAAEPVWNRLSDKDRRAALAGIARYREECSRTGIAMMHGRNYLLHRRWEDEIQQADVSDVASSTASKEIELW